MQSRHGGKLRGRIILQDLPVVIDDPVSSLDANALFSAFGHMRERVKTCGQLFVFTHNFAFFRQLKNWFHKQPRQGSRQPDRRPARFFMLSASLNSERVRSAALGPLDPLLEEFESEYHYLFKRVWRTAHGKGTSGLAEAYSMPNIARRLAESFLAFRYPDKTGDLARRFDAVEYDPAKKTRILRLLHTFSHADAIAEPGHDPTILGETRETLIDLLDMMKSLDPAHVGGLEALVARQSATP